MANVKSGGRLSRETKIQPKIKIKIKSKITIKMGRERGVYTSRGHLTRHTVTTSVNTGDFMHLTRHISRHMPSPDP